MRRTKQHTYTTVASIMLEGKMADAGKNQQQSAGRWLMAGEQASMSGTWTHRSRIFERLMDTELNIAALVILKKSSKKPYLKLDTLSLTELITPWITFFQNFSEIFLGGWVVILLCLPGIRHEWHDGAVEQGNGGNQQPEQPREITDVGHSLDTMKNDCVT